MAQEKLEDLSVEVLKKRKNFAAILIGVMIGIILVNIVLLVTSLAGDKKITYTVYVPGLILIFFIVIMYNGIKKINQELSRRETLK